MRRILFLALAVLTVTVLNAQFTVTGKVTDQNQKPMEFADVMLLKASDSSMVKSVLTNEHGNYKITIAQKDNYVLSTYAMGYGKNKSNVFEGGQKNVDINITLMQEENTLAAAVVTSQRKFVEQHADKMVINPEATISTASDNVLEVLAKSPGVVVDKDGNITVKGKSGISVMIDNRPTQLSGEQLAALLKSLQSTSVDRIEIIENPSARYDAEGSSGIINIKTKEGKVKGYNGSFTSSLNVSKYFRAHSGLDLNYMGKKWSFSANGYFGKGGNSNIIDLERRFLNADGTINRTFEEDATMSGDNRYGGLKLSTNYKINKKHTLGAMVRGGAWDWAGKGDTETGIFDRYKTLIQYESTNTDTDESGTNKSANLNYRWEIDSSANLSADIDFAQYDYGSNSDMTTTYNPFKNPLITKNKQSSETNIYSFKADFEKNFTKNTKLEAGVKFSKANIDSDMNFKEFKHITANWEDTRKMTNRFKYSENINAAYASVKHKWTPKFETQIGLRGEQTIMLGNNVTSNQEVKRNYMNLFPTVFINKTINDNNQINFSYAYRIGRPNYWLLNPFVWMLNPYTYNQGNPDLQPQFTHSMKTSYTFKQKYILSAGYSFTNDQYTQVFESVDSSITVITWKNLSRTENADVTLVVPIEVAPWWKVNANLSAVYIKYESPLNNSILKRSKVSFNTNIMNVITLPKNWGIEVTGRYNSSSIYGVMTMEPRGSVDAGVQKQLFNKKLMIKAGVSDIFKTSKNNYTIEYDKFEGTGKQSWDSRRFRLNITWRFGNANLKTIQQRASGLDEEAGRAGK